MLPFKEDEYQVKICFNCSNRIGPLSLSSLNKNSCFMCGQFIFNNSNKNAYFCLKHQFLMPQCALCKTMIPFNMNKMNHNPLAPTDAKLCSVCYDFRCCSTDN